jgi:predicted permease
MSLMLDLRHALRSLLKSPGLFATAVLLLALGIGATTAVFSVVNRVLLDPLPYPQPDRLVVMWGELQSRNVLHFPESPPYVERYRQEAQLFEDIGGVFTGGQPFVRDGAEPQQITAGVATWNFLSMLGIEPMLGRAFNANDGAFNASEVPPETPFPANVFLPPRTAILSHGLWQREFGGDPEAIGTIVELAGSPVEIVGVMPPGFRLHMPPAAGIASDVDIWVPTRVDLVAAPPNNVFLTVVGRMREGVTPRQAQEEINAITERLVADDPILQQAGFRKWVRPYHSELTADVGQTVWALMGAALFVLLIACANVSNLLLVRAAGRMRQFSIRSALGARRAHLVRQMLLEAGVLAVAGAAAGTLFAFVGLRVLLESAPANIARLDMAGIDQRVLLFTVAISAATTLLAGLAPALRGSRLQAADQLRERAGPAGSPGGSRLRNGLVVGEVALSFVLLIATGLMIRSFMELHRVDPGFEAEGLLTFELNLPFTRYPDADSQNRFYRQLQERLGALPGVTGVSAVLPLPLANEAFHGRYTSAASADETTQYSQAHYRTVLPGWFETMGTEVLSGRYLDADDELDARTSVVVDDTLANKSWPGEQAVGKRLWVRLGQEMTAFEVVGVVRHQAQDSLHEDNRETIWFPNSTAGALGVLAGVNDWIVRTELDPMGLVPQVKGEVAALDASLPLAKVRPMNDYVADARARTRFALQLIAAFGVAALLIAAIGLYAVIHHSALQRRAEVGVRMSFGARGGDILQLFLRHGLVLSIIGIGIGVVTATMLGGSIANLLVGVTAQDLPTYLAAALLFVLIAAAASLVPAWRAARIEPMKVLRED